MQKCALLAPGPVGVKCRFVRDFMLLLAGICGGTKHKRDREAQPL